MSAGFTALGFLDTGVRCPLEVDGGDGVPWQPSTPQIPERQAETLRGTEVADTLPAAEEQGPAIVADQATIDALVEAFRTAQLGALQQALELARRDAQDVEDVEILMLAA